VADEETAMDNVLTRDEDAPASATLNAPPEPAGEAERAEREFIEEPAEPLNGALIVTGRGDDGGQDRAPGWRERLRGFRMGDAFWKAATLFSLAVNLALVLGLLVVGTQVFALKGGIVQPLVGGLYDNFVLMDQSHIVTTIHVNDTIQVHDTIQVNDTIPVVFDVPLQTNTTVVLTQDTAVPRTTVFLNGIGVPTDIVLPAGTPLQINLSLVVPVSQTVPVVLDVPVNLEVPVNLTVPVDIPLDQTELHRPFTNLANLIGPYNLLLERLPSSWGEMVGSD
jgi:hypothetical protein